MPCRRQLSPARQLPVPLACATWAPRQPCSAIRPATLHFSLSASPAHKLTPGTPCPTPPCCAAASGARGMLRANDDFGLEPIVAGAPAPVCAPCYRQHALAYVHTPCPCQPQQPRLRLIDCTSIASLPHLLLQSSMAASRVLTTTPLPLSTASSALPASPFRACGCVEQGKKGGWGVEGWELQRQGVRRSGCSLGVGRTASASPLGGSPLAACSGAGDPLFCVNRPPAAVHGCNHDPTLACHPHPRTCVLAGSACVPHWLPPHCWLDPAHRLPG